MSNQSNRTPLPLSNQKLWDMAKTITEKQEAATKLMHSKVDWNMLQGEWFDWLQEELLYFSPRPELPINNPTQSTSKKSM